jgi:hypothetical protein
MDSPSTGDLRHCGAPLTGRFLVRILSAEPNLSATSFLRLLVNGRQASTPQNGQYLRNKDTLCGRSWLGYSRRIPRRRWFGSTFSDSPARDELLYSCCDWEVAGYEFSTVVAPRGAVEIIRLLRGHLVCQREQTQASRCYECAFVTCRCPLTNLRAAGCALFPKRILRCGLA